MDSCVLEFPISNKCSTGRSHRGHHLLKMKRTRILSPVYSHTLLCLKRVAFYSRTKLTIELPTMRFKSAFTYEQRREKSTMVMQLHPGHIPVICEPCDIVSSTIAPALDKKKYLVHETLTIGQLMNVIRRRMKLPREKALFLLINQNTMAPISRTLREVYARYRDSDGFLYISYAFENVFG